MLCCRDAVNSPIDQNDLRSFFITLDVTWQNNNCADQIAFAISQMRCSFIQSLAIISIHILHRVWTNGTCPPTDCSVWLTDPPFHTLTSYSSSRKLSNTRSHLYFMYSKLHDIIIMIKWLRSLLVMWLAERSSKLKS